MIAAFEKGGMPPRTGLKNRVRDFLWGSRLFPRKLSFTREGKVVVLVSIGLGGAAVNTGNNLLYLVFGLSLALIVISGILSEANLRGLSCAIVGSGRFFAGRSERLTLRVVSRRKRFSAFSIEVWPLFKGWSVEVKPAAFLDVPPGADAAGPCGVVFPWRGEYRLAGMVLSTTFPFSFFRKSVVFEADARVIARPVPSDAAGRRVESSGSGEDEHRPVAGRGQEFLGVRDFREGDNPRHIHHRLSAGRAQPVVKEFEDRTNTVVHVALLNAASSPEHAERDVESAIRTAAGLALERLEQGWTVGLVTASGNLRPGTGRSHAEAILDFLATLPVLIVDERGMRDVKASMVLPDSGSSVEWAADGSPRP